MTVAGFADPARDGARAFRAILDAMARPGRIVEPPAPEPPPGLSPAAASVVLTLVDRDAPLWLSPALRRPDAEAWMRFLTGTAPVAGPGEAAFAMGRWSELAPVLAALRQATPVRPDAGATLLIAVDALAETGPEAEGALRLSGPGIDGRRGLRVDGLAPCFAEARRPACAGFALGFDAILTAGGRLAALPRTTKLEA